MEIEWGKLAVVAIILILLYLVFVVTKDEVDDE